MAASEIAELMLLFPASYKQYLFGKLNGEQRAQIYSLWSTIPDSTGLVTGRHTFV
jgi:hypothetical protein